MNSTIATTKISNQLVPISCTNNQSETSIQHAPPSQAAVPHHPADNNEPANFGKGAIIGMGLGVVSNPFDRWNHMQSIGKSFLPKLEGTLLDKSKQITTACFKGTAGRSLYVATSLATIESVEHVFKKPNGAALSDTEKMLVIAAETATTLPVFTYYRMRMEGIDRKTILRSMPRRFTAVGVASYALANFGSLTLPMLIAPRMEKQLKEKTNMPDTAAGLTAVGFNSGLTALLLNLRNITVDGNPRKGLAPALLRDISYGLALREVSSSSSNERSQTPSSNVS